jgi:peptidoglycan/LPS O-acetylase OafA/YrhL
VFQYNLSHEISFHHLIHKFRLGNISRSNFHTFLLFRIDYIYGQCESSLYQAMKSSHFGMPHAIESILEAGGWEKFKPTAKVSAPTQAIAWLSKFLRPSFSTRQGTQHHNVGRKAYLDGLRGFAALMVYWGHHQMWANETFGHIFENAFGYDKQYYFAALPGIRTFFSGGHFSVTVFFVLSGYVLSSKPLSLIHNYEYEKLGDNLASALFRRWLRLFIPVICTTFIYLTLWHAFGIQSSKTVLRPTYLDEIWNWYLEFKNFSFIFRSGGDPWFYYNFHTWSLPVEFRGSMVVYASLLALSRSTRNARLFCLVGLIFYFMYIVDGSFCAMFLSGVLLCDLDLLAAGNNLPTFLSKLGKYKHSIFPALFFISMYLGGVPSHSLEVQVIRDSPGWSYLSYLKPQAVFDPKWFYLFWAATFLVCSTSRIKWLRWFFETSFNQYLGHISFAFYLVHGPVLWVLGDRLYAATGYVKESHAKNLANWVNAFPIPRVGPLGLELSFLAPNLILLPVTFWLAEIVTKLIDEPSVRLSHWAYKTVIGASRK